MVPDTSCSCYDNYTISTERLQVKADVKPVLSMAAVYDKMWCRLFIGVKEWLLCY